MDGAGSTAETHYANEEREQNFQTQPFLIQLMSGGWCINESDSLEAIQEHNKFFQTLDIEERHGN